jgi:hypothetical protein
MREIAIAAFSVALGAAIQVSGFGGPIAVAVAWAIVVAISLWMLLTLVKKENEEGEAADDESLARRANRLGQELVGFAQEREADAPPTPQVGPSIRVLKGIRGSESSEIRKSFDADTMWIYQRRFAERVIEICHMLRSGGRIGAGEFKSLISPRRPSDIELVGRRLIELGYPER